MRYISFAIWSLADLKILVRRSVQRRPRLVLWTKERKVMAHRGGYGCRSDRIHHGRIIPQHRSQICLAVPLCHRRLLVRSTYQVQCSTLLTLQCQLYHHWLGRSDMWSDPREESRRIINHELYRHDLVYLYSLPLLKIGRTSLPHGDVSECGFRSRCNRVYLCHAILASASKPKDEEERLVNQVVVCILGRVSGQRRREVMYVANLKQKEQESS